MGLLSKTVEIKVNNKTYKHFEELGYKIPRHYNEKKKKWQISTGETITVKVDDLPRGSGINVECQCDSCNRKYDITYYEYNKHDKSKGFFCKNCSHKMIMSGKNHPNWNSNLSDEDRIKGRNYPEYKEFVKRVLVRDNYTCFYCRNTDHNNVVVHHLDGYDWCVDGRTDDTNAVCLCKECHSNFHAHYGMGKNTKQQFEEWIGISIDELNKYDGKISSAKEVICLDDKKIYARCLDASRFYHIDLRQIYFCCNHKPKHLSVQGLHFMWLQEYRTLSEEEIKVYLLNLIPRKWRSVICVTTNKIFDNASIGARFYDMKRGNDKILKVCRGERLSAGVDPVTGEKLVWRFYDRKSQTIVDI